MAWLGRLNPLKNWKELIDLGGQLAAAGSDAEIFPADVTDENQVRQLERAVIGKFGTLQVLINNAGINIRKSLTDSTLEEWRQAVCDGRVIICQKDGGSVYSHYGSSTLSRRKWFREMVHARKKPGRADQAFV